jgi:hypothetical protein
MSSNVTDGIRHGLDTLGLVIGDSDAKLVFQFHDQLNRVKGVGTEVVDEGTGERNPFWREVCIPTEPVPKPPKQLTAVRTARIASRK